MDKELFSYNNEFGDVEYYAATMFREHIDKPISASTSCCIQTSYVKYHFHMQFNRGVFVECLWGTSILPMKRRRLGAAEMTDFSTILLRPD